MLLITKTATTDRIDREDIDRAARELVLHEYRTTLPWDDMAEQVRFDAALEAYQRSFPHVPKAVARQAVAVILACNET